MNKISKQLKRSFEKGNRCKARQISEARFNQVLFESLLSFTVKTVT